MQNVEPRLLGGPGLAIGADRRSSWGDYVHFDSYTTLHKLCNDTHDGLEYSKGHTIDHGRPAGEQFEIRER